MSAAARQQEVVVLDGRTLTPAGVVAIARGWAQARMSAEARERNAAAERLVRRLLDRGELLYGTSTGVGVLRATPSALEDPGEHQWRLVRSHAGGGGAALTVEVVRAAMAVRANQIGAGGAGIGEGLLDGLLGLLRTGVTPLARELGSLGTGDLTVLAEIGVALGGEGQCWVGDRIVPSAEALAEHGLAPVGYGPRDGIGFMSSNAVSIGQAALVFHDASRLLDSALAVAALSYEAVNADLAVLDPRVHAVRPHHGQHEVARRLRDLLGDFEPRERSERGRVHDSFVFRCVPQVEGPLLDALQHLESVLAIELNVAGENALMLPRDGVALPERELPRRRADARARRGARRDGAVGLARGGAGQRAAGPGGHRPGAAARAGPGPRLRRDDHGVHGARRGRRGPLARRDRGVADHDGAVGHRVARQLRRALVAADVGRARADGRRRLGRARARRAGAAPARRRAAGRRRPRAVRGRRRLPGPRPGRPARCPATSRRRGCCSSTTRCG